MKKRIIAVSTLMALVFTLPFSAAAGENATTSEANIPSEISTQEAKLTAGVSSTLANTLIDMDLSCEPALVSVNDAPTVGSSYELKAEVHELKETDDINELNDLIADCASRMDAATQMAEACKTLGYEEDDPVIKLAEEEYSNAESDMNYYQELLADAEKALRKKEKALRKKERALREKKYPAASTVWHYLTETMELNEHVAAGILGNMMAEVGGQTLDLQVDCSGRGYYGICQWSRKYMVYDITGSNLDTQLEYLNKTIEDEFAVFGDLYTSGFTYQDFCNMQNAQDAAKAFAVVYERCGSGSYSVRKSNAVKAYEYYTK